MWEIQFPLSQWYRVAGGEGASPSHSFLRHVGEAPTPRGDTNDMDADVPAGGKSACVGAHRGVARDRAAGVARVLARIRARRRARRFGGVVACRDPGLSHAGTTRRARRALRGGLW